jgi:hypothetical protein
MFGRPEPTGVPGNEPVHLYAGSLNMILSGAALRKITYGTTEIVRSIYAAVRDRDWGTVPFTLYSSDLVINTDSFRIIMHGGFEQDGILGQAEIRIAGGPTGKLEFRFHFTAGSSFLKNRIGICVLLPIEECKGMPYHLVQTDGGEIPGRFPVFIAPHQPLLDIRSLTWNTPDRLKPSLTFEGDVFEMEDQRNWTDASFKIYSTPLSQPFPVEVAKGEICSQLVRLSLSNPLGIPDQAGYEEPVKIRLTSETCRMPLLGICLGKDNDHHPDDIKKAVAELSLTHLQATIRLSAEDAVDRAKEALSVAKELGCALELVLLTTGGIGLPDGLMRLLNTSQAHLARIMVFSEKNFASNGEAEVRLLSHLRETLDEVRIGGGSNANFAELNRNRIPQNCIDFIGVAANPQVHAEDDLSLIENLDGLRYLVESMEKLYPGDPVTISPLSLKPRFNAVSTSGSSTFDDSGHQENLMMSTDFGAMWILGALKELAESETDSVTLYGRPTAQSPLYLALRLIAGLHSNRRILKTGSSRPEAVRALVLTDGLETLAFLLKFENQALTVEMPVFPGNPELFRINDLHAGTGGLTSSGNLRLLNSGIYILRYKN